MTDEAPIEDQPVAEAPEMGPEPLVTPQLMSVKHRVALDSIIAEHYLGWEVRRMPVPDKQDGTIFVPHWRAPRDSKFGSRAGEWLREPHPFSRARDPQILEMADSIAGAHGYDFLLSSLIVPHDEGLGLRAYVAGFGQAYPSGGFHFRFRALAAPAELACCLVVAKHLNVDKGAPRIDEKYRELFEARQ